MSFLNRNYLKLLASGFVGTSTLLVSAMVDSLIAGRYLSAVGLTAVSLASPYFSVCSFLSSMVLSGANISINQSVGAKDMSLADRQFSNALYAQLLIGASFAALSVLLLNRLPALLGASGQTAEPVLSYLGGVAPYSFVFPMAAFLSGMAYYDGDAKIAVSGQLLTIASNILLSLYLVRRMGIRGIAIATVLANLLGCCVYALHFITRACPFRLVRTFSLREMACMAKVGLPGISIYLFVAIAIAAVNNYIGRVHGAYVLYLFALSNTLVGALANIPGAAGEALAPMASLYAGENNALMLRRLVKLALKCVLLLAAAAALPVYIAPDAICRLYSVSAGDAPNVIRALELFAASLFLSGVGNLLVIYYMVRGRTLLALVYAMLRCLLLFVFSFMLLGSLSPHYLWLAVSLSESLSLLILWGTTTALGKKRGLTPLFLFDRAEEEKIRVWDFSSAMDAFLSCGHEAENLLLAKGYAEANALKTSLLIEEVGVLLSRYPCRVEITLIIREGIELIVRDTSPKWDIANADDAVASFEQYAALRILNGKANKQFFRTIGCNKISFVIE